MQILGLTPDLPNQKLGVGGGGQQSVSPPGDSDPVFAQGGDQGRTVS